MKLEVLLSVDEHTESRSSSYEDEYVKANFNSYYIIRNKVY